MSVTGADGIPQRVSTALSDVAAGTVGAFAVAAALVRQQRTGAGEIVDISLLEADLAFMSPRIASFLAGDAEPRPCSGTDSVVAIYQSMRTADRPIVVAIGNDGHWRRACQALGLDHLAERDDLATNAGRRAKRHEVVDAFQERFAALPSADALKLMHEAGVPSAPINTLSEVVADPQVRARGHSSSMSTPSQASSAESAGRGSWDRRMTGRRDRRRSGASTDARFSPRSALTTNR